MLITNWAEISISLLSKTANQFELSKKQALL
jgi:hypothetical protein